MKSSETIALPVAEFEYDRDNEQKTRRSIEMAIQDLRQDVVSTQNSTDSSASLALRKHQFLLMGA